MKYNMEYEMDGVNETACRGSISLPISIPDADKSRSIEGEKMQSYDTYDFQHVESDEMGSYENSSYDSPKLPRPSNDFTNVMVRFRPNKVNMASSCPSYRSSPVDSLFASHKSDSSIEIQQIPSALSPSTDRRRTRRNVHFDEATITVTAELGESAARFRSKWRQKHKLSISPLIKFGSKNIIIQHDDELPANENVLNKTKPSSYSPSRGKSIFDVCNYSAYGRYT